MIAYLTDVEGMWGKLASFASGNAIVRWTDRGRLEVAPGGLFVFGGDAIDRGDAARRVLAALLDVKLRQPHQVVLLAGNRDINKLRLARELGGRPLLRTPAAIQSGPRAELLRWIFLNSMGAPDAFELRRAELAHEGADTSDDAVVDSTLADLEPRGLLCRYLAACQLAFRHGRTLFVHGGVSEVSLGAVPGRLAVPARLIDVDVEAWIATLNAWYAEQVDAFIARAGAITEAAPPWQPLIAYQAPLPGSRENPGSVIYGRSVDDHNNLRLPAQAVIDALAASGVERMVVGHTPSGDSPSILRTRGGPRFELVCADNSHARHDRASQLVVDDEHVSFRALTRLDDDAEGAALHELHTRRTRTQDGPLGLRQRAGGALVRGQLADGRWLTFRAHAGFRVEQRALATPGEGDELEAPR